MSYKIKQCTRFIFIIFMAGNLRYFDHKSGSISQFSILLQKLGIYNFNSPTLGMLIKYLDNFYENILYTITTKNNLFP